MTEETGCGLSDNLLLQTAHSRWDGHGPPRPEVLVEIHRARVRMEPGHGRMGSWPHACARRPRESRQFHAERYSEMEPTRTEQQLVVALLAIEQDQWRRSADSMANWHANKEGVALGREEFRVSDRGGPKGHLMDARARRQVQSCSTTTTHTATACRDPYPGAWTMAVFP